MAPLVLHNVPDEELYTGKDGVTRPFAIIGATDERRSSRLRRPPQTSHGSFGRVRARTGARAGGPAPSRRAQQPTVQPAAAAAAATTMSAADEIFSGWKRTQNFAVVPHLTEGETDETDEDESTTSKTDRQTSPDAADATTKTTTATDAATTTATAPPSPPSQPTEIILRGYGGPNYQYAAIRHYERLAGRICEDYPRDPPVLSRRRLGAFGGGSFGGLHTDSPAALTPAERQAVMQRVAGGRHWVKVTFVSAAAADAALYASPQSVLGCLVAAEPYRGVDLPPAADVAVPDPDALLEAERAYHEQAARGRGEAFGFPPRSAASSYTLDSATVDDEDHEGVSSSAAALGSNGRRRRAAPPSTVGSTINDFPGGWHSESTPEPADVPLAMQATQAAPAAPAAPPPHPTTDDVFCRRIPTARRATLKAPEQALLPRESAMRSLFKQVPLLHRLTGTVIGNQVPRRDDGIFDWDKASLYWKLMWFLDYFFALFGGEILDANKDD